MSDERAIETVADLVAVLLKLPQDATVRRQMTAPLGTIEIEQVRLERPDLVVID